MFDKKVLKVRRSKAKKQRLEELVNFIRCAKLNFSLDYKLADCGYRYDMRVLGTDILFECVDKPHVKAEVAKLRDRRRRALDRTAISEGVLLIKIPIESDIPLGKFVSNYMSSKYEYIRNGVCYETQRDMLRALVLPQPVPHNQYDEYKMCNLPRQLVSMLGD